MFYIVSHFFYNACKVSTRNFIFGFKQSESESGQHWFSPKNMPVSGIGRVGYNFNQQVLIFQRRLFYLFQLKNFRSAIFCFRKCFHLNTCKLG